MHQTRFARHMSRDMTLIRRGRQKILPKAFQALGWQFCIQYCDEIVLVQEEAEELAKETELRT